jgi:hypothetical protein
VDNLFASEAEGAPLEGLRGEDFRVFEVGADLPLAARAGVGGQDQVDSFQVVRFTYRHENLSRE